MHDKADGIIGLSSNFSSTMSSSYSISIAGLLFIVALVLFPAAPAKAHNGPPFPIIENHKMAGCSVSLWTHPDIGTGTFFVLLDPVPGGKIPGDLRIEIGIQPESGRLAEVMYAAVRSDSRGQVEYNASAEFDRDEFYRVRLVLRSSQGTEEALSRVEATPPGYGRWDLLLYLLPFLAVGFLWFRGLWRRRRYKEEQELAGRIMSARRV